MDVHEELEIAALDAVTNNDSLSAPPTPVPELQTLPKFQTTVLPSNGQIVVEETDELIATALTIMKEDLAKKPAWSGAPTPTDDFLLMFLRAEVFSPTMAGNRYRKFWETKISLFGEENAALPVTAEAAMEGLKTEVMQIVPSSRDLEGRQVVLINTANSDLSVSRENRIKAVWYILLLALEDVETQRRGFCFVVTFKNAKLTQVDHKFNKACLASVQGALPVRVGSHQMCHPPPFFRVFWVVLSTFMNRRVKKRIRFCVGSNKKVVQKLGAIIAAENVPSPIGSKDTHYAKWLEERIRIEA